MKIKRIPHLIVAIAAILAPVVTPLNEAFAIDEKAWLDIFASNGIKFYDPTECDNQTSDKLSLNVGDLPAETVAQLEAEGIADLAQANMERYKYAEQKTGIPWQAIAALHYREANMRSDRSISNGQPLTTGGGCYTNVDGVKICSDPNEDAEQSANILYNQGTGTYGVDIKQSPTIENLGKAFLGYNRGSMYKSAGNTYEESPYVSNGIDENHMNMKFIRADDCSPTGCPRPNGGLEGKTDGRPGALAVYIYLGGTFDGSSSTSKVGMTASDGSNITWIGDSLSAFSDTYGILDEEVPQLDTSYIQGSKHWWMDSDSSHGGDSGKTILSNIVSQNKLNDVLVFPLGTNDPNAVSESNINEILTLAKDAKKIVFVTNWTTTASYDQNNSNMKAAASSDSRVKIADWESYIKQNTDKLLSDGVHPTKEGAQKFVELILEAVGDMAIPGYADACCDPADGSNGLDEIWAGTKYDFTEGQLRGILSVAVHENGGSLSAIKTELSIMANLFEYNGPKLGEPATTDGFVHYIQRKPGSESGWFATYHYYDESYNAGSNDDTYLKAATDILKNGNRTLPPEILEHDCIQEGACTYGIVSGENDGTPIDLHDKSQYKKGVTKLSNPDSTYIFYTWADPENESGDPFGYFESNPPKGNSTKGSNVEACCDSTIGGVTKTTIDGHEYAFPLAGATKANYMNYRNFNDSVLSPLPCTNLNPGACHHDYLALDLGLYRDMVDGKMVTAADHAGDGYSDLYYYSEGVKVVAIVGGTINYARHTYSGAAGGWESKCGSISLKGEDGHTYFMTHIAEESIKVSDGDTVKAGDELAAIGAPQCAQGTQSHLHIDTYYNPGDHSDALYAVTLINQLYEKLPDSDSGSGVTSCPSGGLKVGGLTQEEAEDLMAEYRKVMESTQGSTSYTMETADGGSNTLSGIRCDGSMNGGTALWPPNVMKNCVSFSWWFLNKYVGTTAGLPNGKDVVNALKQRGYETGTEPRPYAIFSISYGGSNQYGHTGVVLGVIDETHFIVGEASCSKSLTDPWQGQVHEYTTSDYNWTFAYTDDKIKF